MTESTNKIIILTDKNSLQPVLESFADENGITMPDATEELSSLAYLKEKSARTGTVAWIKKDIVKYISRYGAPLMIITDLKIDAGIDHDSDNLRTLRTIILSFILIALSESPGDALCNLFILANPDDYRNFTDEVNNPQRLLNHIITSDSRVNEIINQMKTDQTLFKKNFNIHICNSGSNEIRLKSELNTFLSMIKVRKTLGSRLKKSSKAAMPENLSAAPADIVFRLDDFFYVNGEIVDCYNFSKSLNIGEIYIIGNFTSFTRVEVIERLLKLIKNGPTRDYSFRKHPEIILHIPGESVIDITTPVSIAQILSKELSDFKNLRIKTTITNSKKMKESKGYSMIQKNLVLYND